MPEAGDRYIGSSQDQASLYFGLLVVLSLCISVLIYSPMPAIVPLGLVLVMFAISKLRFLYGLFFFLLPFSIEFELPGGFGTDLPSEPLMLFLSLVCLLFMIRQAGTTKTRFLRHPISLLLILHVAWIFFTSLSSVNGLFSFKFLLAKLWYVLPFYVLPLLIFQEEKDYRFIIKCLIAGLSIAVTYVMLRHALEGFSFKSINHAVRPIFRNHVNYGVMLVLALPFLMYLKPEKGRIKKLVFIALSGFFLLAIYLTYTRAAQLSVVLAMGAYLVLKWRLARPAILLALACLIALFTYLSFNNNYLDLAPEYTKAIEHKKFDNLVEATTKMEDISTVERFYRWIAGFNMVKEKPLTGFGPATFYEAYRPYTITSYKTYVSDNPEKSGIHNYYLMTAVEQGIPGLVIFLSMVIMVILYAEKVVHGVVDNGDKKLVLASGTSFVIVLAVLFINDLLEADKVGPFFFLIMAIICAADLKLKNKNSEKA